MYNFDSAVWFEGDLFKTTNSLDFLNQINYFNQIIELNLLPLNEISDLKGYLAMDKLFLKLIYQINLVQCFELKYPLKFTWFSKSNWIIKSDWINDTNQIDDLYSIHGRRLTFIDCPWRNKTLYRLNKSQKTSDTCIR